MTESIAAMLRPGDLLVRYGGEEFVVMLQGSPHAETVAIADRLRLAVATTPSKVARGLVTVTVSAGAASVSEVEANTPSALLELADRRLYEAKAAGRNRTHG